MGGFQLPLNLLVLLFTLSASLESWKDSKILFGSFDDMLKSDVWKTAKGPSGVKLLPEPDRSVLASLKYDVFGTTLPSPVKYYLELGDASAVYQEFSLDKPAMYELTLRFVAGCTGATIPVYVRLGLEHTDGTFEEHDINIDQSSWVQFVSVVCFRLAL
jgi:hypothetical protein